MSCVTITQPQMQKLYYEINPKPHSEKAYQKGDPSAPIASVPTEVGKAGTVVVLVTTIYNKAPQGAAEFALHSSSAGPRIAGGSGGMPYRYTIGGLQPGARVHIQPLSLGTMAKVLTLGVTTAYARLGYIASIARLDPIARAYFRKAEETLGHAAEPADRAVSLYLDAFHHLGRGAWDRVEALAVEAAEILETIGDRQEAEVALTIGGHALYYRGRADDALARYRAITASARGRANAQHIGWGLFLGARSSMALGRVPEALDALREARRHMAAVSDRLTGPIGEGLYAEALLRSAQPDEAVAVARALLPSIDGAPLPLAPCLHAYSGVAEALTAAWEAGDPSARLQALGVLARFAAFAALFPIAVPALLRAAGRACAASARDGAWGKATRGARHRAASSLFRRSASAARAAGMPYEVALADSALAQLASS